MKRIVIAVITLAAGMVLAQAGDPNVRLVHPLGEDEGNTCIDIPCRTIGRAIDVAAAGDIVDIAAGEYTEILTIDKSLTLQGAGQENITIIQAHEKVGHALGRVITISEEGLEVEISDVTIRHGRALDSSGAGLFVIGGVLALTNVTFSDNFTDEFGGGLSAVRSESELTDVIFRSNHAGIVGGGMSNSGSSTILTGVKFINNTADARGGGLSSHGIVNGPSSEATLTNVDFMTNSSRDGGGMFNSGEGMLTDVIFTDNSASFRGGGLYASSTPSLVDVTFDENNAQRGGGMYSEINSAPELNAVTFINNEAQQGGGVYSASSSSPELTAIIFANNRAVFDPGNRNFNGSDIIPQGEDPLAGGGMFNASKSMPMLNDVTFSDNSATSRGGGIYNENSRPVLNEVTFVGNSAGFDGGGMGNNDDSVPTLFDVNFDNNSAGGSGGGMFNSGSSPSLTNVTFRGNHAGGGPEGCTICLIGEGGGMANLNSSPELTNALFSGNEAGFIGIGGGMSNSNSVPRLTNVTFSGNRADAQGGGMYNSGATDPTQVPILQNSIFWNNQDETGTGTANASITNADQTSFVATFSLIEGRLPPGDGNLDGANPDNDPLFLNMPDPGNAPMLAGNLRLRPESPVIDAGNDAFVDSIDTDLASNPRIIGTAVDLGPYEFTGEIDDVIFRDRFEAP